MLGLHPIFGPLHQTPSGNASSGLVASVDSLAVVGKLPSRSVSEFLLAESKACPRMILQSIGKIMNTSIANVITDNLRSYEVIILYVTIAKE